MNTTVLERADLSSWRWTRQHLEVFTDLYLQHDVLLQLPAKNNKKVTQERSAALRSLGAALEPGLEPLAYRTRSIIYMYRCLCRTELRVYIAAARSRNDLLTTENILQHAPEWLRRAEDKLRMLPQLIAEGYIKPNVVTKPPRAPRSSCLLSLAGMARASRGSLARASRGILPLTVRTDHLEAMWDRLRHMSLHKLSRLRRRECDSLWLHEWLAVDVVLMYDYSFSLITEETFQDPMQEADLARVLKSVQLLRGRAGPARASAAWADARYAYCMAGCYVSLVMLQRLWCEMRALTRRALAPSATAPPPPASEPRSAAALQFYKKVVNMYPSVLSDPEPAWRDLVAAGALHEDQYDVGEVINISTEECAEVLDELMERDKDDDIILIEKEIETVELNESSDEESPAIDKDKALRKSEMEALRSSGKALSERLGVALQQQSEMVTQSRGDYQQQGDTHQCPTRSIKSMKEAVEFEEPVEQAETEADDDGDSVEKSSSVTEQSSIALLKKLNPNICKTVLIFEDDDDDSSDTTNHDDLIDGENVAELKIEQPIDDNITKDNTDIIERALKVRDALEPVTPTKSDISNTSSFRNYSDSDNLLTDGVKTLNDKTMSLIKETIPDDSVSKYFTTNYNETKPTAVPANNSENCNTVTIEIIPLDSQPTAVIPDHVSIDNLVTTSDCQNEITPPKPNDNDIPITKRIKSNVIPADIAREIQMKKDIHEKKYKRILPKQDIAIDNRIKKHIESLENETKISVLQAEIANEMAKGTNDDKTKTSTIPANDNYNIVISDVKSLVNGNKISNRSLLKPNIANVMTNDIKPRNSNHIIEHSYSQNAECDPHDFSQENNNKDHIIDNDYDSDNSCELVIEESDSRLKQTDSSIEQCGSQIKQDDSLIEQCGSQIKQDDSLIEQCGSQIKQDGSCVEQTDSPIEQCGSQLKQSDSQIDIKPTASLMEQKTEYDALKYFQYKQSNESKTIVSFDNIIPWIRPLNRVIKSEQSGSGDRQSGSNVRQSGSSVRQSCSGVALSSDSAEDSDDTVRSEHSFGSNDSDVEFDIDPKLLQMVSVPLVRCDYRLSRSHVPSPTPLQFNLTDRHEVNDPKETPKNVSKVNDLKETPYDTDTSDSESDDLVIDSDADYEPSDKTVLYSSDDTRGKNERDILHKTREKETDTYFDVAWKNLSADFILNRRNIELMALCRPLSVVLERLSPSVGGGRETEGDGGEGRRQKRVRLSDIEEVRRVNRSLLTAQVAPIAADPAGGDAESGLLTLKQCLEQPQRQPNFTVQLQQLQKQRETAVKTAVQKERQRLQEEKQQRQEALKCGQQRLREGSKYCCAAKRHRALNDARRRMYRGNNLAPPRELPLHDFSHKSTNKCMCCCTHLLVKPTQNKPKVKPGPKSKKPRQPNEKEKKRKKTKPTSKSKSKPRNRKKIIPTATLEELDEKLKDDLEEWNRQKTINQKYFYISSMMTDKNKATPIDNTTPIDNDASKDNAAPKNNTTPIDNNAPKDNAAPKNNTTPIDNDAPKDNAAPKSNTTPIDNDATKDNAIPKNNTTPIDNTTTKCNATPIDKPKDNITPIHNDTLKYHATPKDNAPEKATDQTKVSTAPVSHLFHTQSIPIHNKYFHQTTIKLCMNMTNGKTDKPIDEAPSTSTSTKSLGNPSNDQNIEKTVKPPPPLLPLRVRSDLCAANQPTTFVNLPSTFVNQPSTSVNQNVIFKNQPASVKNQTASFVNQPLTFVNQPSTSVNQPGTFKNQPASVKNQTASFVNQPLTFVNQPSTSVNQPGTFKNQPASVKNQTASFVNQPLTFVNQPSTSVNQPGTFKNQPASVKNQTASFVNQPLTFVNQPSTAVNQPVTFKIQPASVKNQTASFVNQPLTFVNKPSTSVNQPVTFKNQPALFKNQTASFVNQPLTFVNQPSTSVNQPVTFKNQPASFKNQTASFVNQPATFIKQPAAYVYQPSKFVKQPVTFVNQPVKFVHQHVTSVNQPKKNLNQPTSTNQPVTTVNQLHFTSSLIPVSFKMMPPKAANTQKFVKIAPKPPPPLYEKLDPKTLKIEPTDTPSEKQIYNTKENVKLTDNELNQPDGSLFHNVKLLEDKVLEHRDSTKTTKAMPLTEQILIQRALDDVTSMELEPGGDETEMKIPLNNSVTSQRRRASCDVIDAVAPKRRASDVINHFSSEITIRTVDKPGPPKLTLEQHKITIKPLTMTEKPRDVTTRSLEVAGSQDDAKESLEVTNSSNEVKIKIESSELTKEDTSDIEPVLKENSSIMSELEKTLDHHVEGKDKDSEIPNVVIKKEEDKSTASIEDSMGQNEDNMGQSKDSFQQSGAAIRPSDDIGSSEMNIELIEDTKEESHDYALWSNDYTEPTDWKGPSEDAVETSEINMGTREVNVGPSEYTLVSSEHGLWSSDDAMGQSDDSMGPSGGTAGQSEVIMEPSDMAHSKDTKGQSHVRTEESIDITEDSSNDVAEVFDDVTCASGATNVTKESNVTSQIRVVLKTNNVPTTMTVGVTSRPYTMTLNTSNVSKGTSNVTAPTSFTSVVTKLRVHLDAESTITSTSSATASNMAASRVVETAPSNVTCDITRSSDSSDVEEISETGPPPQLPPLSIRVGDLHMLPPVRARDLAEGRDPTQLSIHRVDLSRDPMLLKRCYLLVTEHDIPCRDPTYFYIGPKNEARMILFEDDVRPPSVKRHKKSKIQVKDFARVEAGNAYNSISVGGAAVPAETASSTDILLGAAPDRLTAGAGNLFQKITNEPLVYAQVHTVVQSLRRARHLLLQQAPLAVLSTASGEVYPLLRDVTLRPVGLSCAVPGALHDLVDRLNAQSNEAIAQRSMKTITVPDSDED